MMLPVIWWFMRDDPAEVGERAFGERRGAALRGEGAAPPSSSSAAGGNPAKRAMAVLAEAVGVRDFWMLAGSFSCAARAQMG